MRFGHIAMPHEKRAVQLNEYKTIQNWLHEVSEELVLVEEHMKTCHSEFHWSHRADLMEKKANLEERIAELEGKLDLEEN